MIDNPLTIVHVDMDAFYAFAVCNNGATSYDLGPF
jgi:hypothetical protein